MSFKEIDIDKMLEQTTLDDFLRGLYVSATSSPSAGGQKTQQEKLMGMFMGQTDKDDELASRATPTL